MVSSQRILWNLENWDSIPELIKVFYSLLDWSRERLLSWADISFYAFTQSNFLAYYRCIPDWSWAFDLLIFYYRILRNIYLPFSLGRQMISNEIIISRTSRVLLVYLDLLSWFYEFRNHQYSHLYSADRTFITSAHFMIWEDHFNPQSKLTSSNFLIFSSFSCRDCLISHVRSIVLSSICSLV